MFLFCAADFFGEQVPAGKHVLTRIDRTRSGRGPRLLSAIGFALLASWLVFGLARPAPAAAQGVQLAPFGGGFTQPFHVAGDPSDSRRVFVVEAAGRIRLVENGVTQPAPFLDASADVWDLNEGGCECGMFSVAFPPDYATSGRFYVFYTRDVLGASANVAPFHDLVIREYQRSSADPDVADESTARDVLVIEHRTASNHNGGQLQFGPDGLLYAAVGDGGDTPDQARSLTSMLGKILRIDPVETPASEYVIPAGNPFADGPGPNADEIYAYGLRNPYRFSFDRLTGALTIGDVGQGAWEEVDYAPLGQGRGANFGWNCFEGSALYAGRPTACDPPPANHVRPVIEYPHPTSGPAAVVGGHVVRDLTVPSLLGRYLYADTYDALGGEIFAATLSSGGASGVASTGLPASSVVSFGEDACGHIYVAEIGGAVSRIEPTGGSPACRPQLALTASPTAADADPPGLEVRAAKSRRAGARGELRVRVACDEACEVRAEGEVVLPGRDASGDPDRASLAAGADSLLRLDLSRREAKRIIAVLRRDGRAVAVIEVSAADGAGNRAEAERKLKQRL